MRNNRPRVGKYILDSLSTGMYNHPLMLIREYIQNSTDAIDSLLRTDGFNKRKSKIEIKIDPKTNSFTISDNGTGIKSEKAWSTLHDIGKSEKSISHNRGFRGIGRLGGLGYCQILRFITKAIGEKKYTVSTWDCEKLRKLIKENNDFDTADIIQTISDFKQFDYLKNYNDHFFIVEMLNLQSSRDILLNVPAIRSYISQVAPVPFNREYFSYANRIDEELRSKVPNYETYRIYINGEQIFKPYNDKIILRGEVKDKINEIDFTLLNNENFTLAFGWLARLNLLGSVSSSSLVDGIRIRHGNILIGDENLLSEFFREKRFNNYLVGELHITDDRIIPNSRRDDFEDNEQREMFYEHFIKEIGIPFSKKIRRLSQERSKQNRENKDNNLLERANLVIEKGFLSFSQKEFMVRNLEKLKERNIIDNKKFINLLINSMKKTEHYLDREKKDLCIDKKELFKSIFEIIYRRSFNKKNAEEIIQEILGYIA